MGEFDDAIRQTVGEDQTNASILAFSGSQEDPERAARARELEKVTGVPSAAILGDFETFEQRHKAAMASDIVRNNAYITQYVNSHPLASRISNDDYGNLDDISSLWKKAYGNSRAMQIFNAPTSVAGAAFEGFKEAWDSSPWGSWAYKRDIDQEYAKARPLEWAFWTGIGIPIEAVGRALSAGLGGASKAAEHLYTVGGGDEGEAKRFGREIAAWGEYFTTKPPNLAAGGPHGPRELTRNQAVLEKYVHEQGIREFVEKMKPYALAGEEPPPGVHPWIDEVKRLQAEQDLKVIEDLEKAVDQSMTKQRSPEFMQKFLAQHPEITIGINAEALAKAGPQKFEFIPGLAEQLEIGLAHGGDVQVPLSHWLNNVDPQMAKDLHDFIRVRRGGVTLDEAKRAQDQFAEKEPPKFDPNEPEASHVIKEEADVSAEEANRLWKYQEDLARRREVKALRIDYVDQAIDAVRDATDTKFALGEKAQKLTLRRNQPELVPEQGPFHTFDILNEKNEPVSYMLLSEQNGGKTLYVEDIGLEKMNVNGFGPMAIRQLLRQLREQFPNAEEITGFRASGARFGEAAPARTDKDFQKPHFSPKIKFDELDTPQGWTSVDQLREFLNQRAEAWDYGQGVTAHIIPDEKLRLKEEQLIEKVNEVIQRIAPHANIQHAEMITIKSQGPEREVLGLHRRNWDENGLPLIMYTLNNDPLYVGRHEAVHALRNYGFFTEKEWRSLENAAQELGWFERGRIQERYGDKGLDRESMLEEAIVDEFGRWGKEQAKLPPEIQTLFERMREFFKELLQALKEVFGADVSWEKLFKKIESGEIGERGIKEPLADISPEGFRGITAAAEKQPELPGITRLEDRALFEEAKAVGMTVDTYKRYIRLIDKKAAEDLAKQKARAEEDAKRRLTQEWKENEARMQEEVAAAWKDRPDVGVDRFFREGEIYGERMGYRPKMNEEFLTKEQKASLPDTYYGPEGIHPDDVASMFGYTSAGEMIRAQATLIEQRKASGKRPMDFSRQMIKDEVARRMEEKYGNLSENIMQEAREHVIGTTQLDLLHEETVALAAQAGMEISLDRAGLEAALREKFAKIPAAAVDVKTYLANAGKAGRALEEALLKGKPADAFKAKQSQYFSMLMAKLGEEFGKEKAKFEKLAKRFSVREVPKVDKDFASFTQSLLGEAGLPMRRDAAELATAMQRSGYDSLRAFVDTHIADGWELAVSEPIKDRNFKKVEDMTVEEFREFSDAITSMAHVGRKMQTIELAGEIRDFAEFRAQVIDNIKQLPLLDPAKKEAKIFKFDAMFTRMEEIAKDLDLRKEAGPLWDAIIRPMAEGKHTEYDMLEKLSKRMSEITAGSKEWRKTLSDTIPNNFFFDPYFDQPVLFDLSRQDMIGIMLNWGTRSNIEKFTRGYAMREGLSGEALKAEAAKLEERLNRMFEDHATKEDWEFVQNIWNIFKEWRPLADEMYYKLSGVAPKWIPSEARQTPHGNFEGGYYPIIYDPKRSNINVIEERTDTKRLFAGDYFRATPGNAYAKERTGYTDRVLFQGTIEMVAGRMQQMIHDISYRQAVMDVGKVIRDRAFREAMRKHYGESYEAQLDPWLKDIANHFNASERAISDANMLLRRFRYNLMSHALGLNLNVILSPDVGMLNPSAVARTMWNREANVKLAWEKSMEIPHTFRNMDRDFRERLEQTMAAKGWDSFQAAAVRWAFWPVVKTSQGFRIITFVEEYKKALAKGMDDGAAARWADSLVRERHGSGGLPDLPSIMRSNEAFKAYTLFYGYFNTMYNWQRQIPGQLRRGEYANAAATLYGSVIIGAAFGAVLFNKKSENDSWFKHIGKAILLQPLSTIPFVREGANFFIEGNKSRSPLSTIFDAAGAFANDVKKKWQGKKVEKPVQHTGNVVGLLTGLPMAQASRTAEFLYDTKTGSQRPKNIFEWMRGIRTGESKEKKK